jgi:septum site-determining protein MinD
MGEPQARVYALSSGKGGVGKTTLTVNLGAAMAKLGQRVLLLDGNLGMGDVATFLGLEDASPTLLDLLTEPALPTTVSPVSAKTVEGLNVLPSGYSVGKFVEANLSRLEQLIASLRGQYQQILIDTPPGLGPDCLYSLRAADMVLLLVNPELPSVMDGFKLMEVVKALSKPYMVVVNKYRKRKGPYGKFLTPAGIESILGAKVEAVVPHEEKFQLDPELKIPLVVRKPKAKASKVLFGLAERLIRGK